MKDAKVKRTDAKSRTEIWPILNIFRVFWPLMRQFNMNQAINHRYYEIYWYKSIEVGFIRKYSFLAIFRHTFFGHNSAIFGPISHLQTRPKSWPTRWNFWVNRYLEIMFQKISGEQGKIETIADYIMICDIKG